jgi:membrane-bound ClpP family serine protease
MTALGVALLVVGAVVIMAEAHVQSLGILGGPGVVMVGAGAIFAVSGLGGGILVGVFAALLLAAVGISIVGVSLSKGMAVRRRRVRAGPEGLIGHLGVVRSWSGESGCVELDGALWRARLSWPVDEDEPRDELHVGDEVVVERLDGLTVAVRPAERWELVR